MCWGGGLGRWCLVAKMTARHINVLLSALAQHCISSLECLPKTHCLRKNASAIRCVMLRVLVEPTKPWHEEVA